MASEELEKALANAQTELRKNIAKFNEALRESVREEYERISREYADAKIFRLNLDNGSRGEIRIEDLKSLPDDNYISYYWIEYDYEGTTPWQKLAFFCKDIDAKTCNVHVIPGVFEKFVRFNKLPNDIGYVCDKDSKILIKNIPNVNKQRYFPFAERCGKDWWWVPTPAKEDIIRRQIERSQKEHGHTISRKEHGHTISRFAELEIEGDKPVWTKFKGGLSLDFKKAEESFRNSLHALSEELKWKWAANGGKGPKYSMILWDEDTSYNTKYCMYFTKIMYSEDYGFFSRYNCINFDDRSNTRRKTEETTIEIAYDKFSENSDKVLTLTGFTIDDFQNKIKELLPQVSGDQFPEPKGDE